MALTFKIYVALLWIQTFKSLVVNWIVDVYCTRKAARFLYTLVPLALATRALLFSERKLL